MSAQLFTVERADALAGPAWLRELRSLAASRAAAFDLPTAKVEEWRYSRIDSLPLSEFPTLLTAAAGGIPDRVSSVLADLGDHSGHLVTVDGVLLARMGCAAAESAGVTFGAADDPEAVAWSYGQAADAFAAWNEALAVTPLVLDVPPGVELGPPFVVVHHVSVDGSASFPKLSVRAGAGSSVAVIELFTSDDVRALSVPCTRFQVGPAARVRHTVVQNVDRRIWQIGSVSSDVAQEATWSSGVAALGGEYARMRIDCRLSGRGASGNVAAAYLGSGSQMIDLRTFQHHDAADTTSDLYFKGALADHAHSVYSGLIHIVPEARGSNAVQANRVVKMSEHTWAESVPNLEIENNDVRCAHASTVGPIDLDQRFYLESRGVPPRAAERLIVGGFFEDALEHFAVPEAAAHIAALIEGELDVQVAELGATR